MTLEEFTDKALNIQDTTGNVSIGRDEFYGVFMKHPTQEHGYTAKIMVKNAMHTGRGLTVEEALDALALKLKLVTTV